MKQETLRKIKLGSVMACMALAWNAFATDGKWNADAADNWGTASRWTNSQIATGIGATADISFNITAARTLTLDSARTVGKLRFEDATTASHDWTFSASSANPQLTLDVTSGSPIIEVANQTVQFNTVLAGSKGFTKNGGGTLSLNPAVNNLTGKIVLNAGTTRFKATGTFGADPGTYVADQVTLNGAVLMNNDAPLTISPNLGITLGNLGGRLQAGWSKPITIESPIVGTGALTNVTDATPGIISLNAANTYTGPTLVAGWFQVNGSLDAASAVTVQSGGLLLGNGTINGRLTVLAGGNVGAGGLFAPGTLTVNNSANLTG
ncbi:MAG TPA: hypothetical protein VNT26_10775, partial [Candidatus Sulfotelmatobacter sp.]|nr:hypothetical protein [Candidatus Sulfotelmatobacter sp.]